MSTQLKLYQCWCYHPRISAVICAKSGHELKDILIESADILESSNIYMSIIGVADKKLKKGIVLLLNS